MFFVIHVYAYPSGIVRSNYPFQDTTKVTKSESKVTAFLKSIFNHNDSTKQARQFIHQHHKVLKDNKSPNFATSTDTIISRPIELSEDFELDYEVLGWYPYWENDYYKQLNFSLLSTVAYFSYEVNPKTGDAITTHDWETTALIDSIRTQPNKKILLTVSNFGDTNNRKFLKNPDAIDTLISNLITLLSKREGNGVCIDFEGVAKKQKSEYTGFLLTLSNRLKKANKDYEVYITVPSVNWSDALDFKAINQAIDRFVIMGYDYYGQASTVAGPVAPLKSGQTWEPYNLTTSVDYYINSGIASSKIILALPTYGSLWETKNLNLKSKVKKYIGSRTYSYIKTNIGNNEAIYIEPVSKSAYSTYKIKSDKTQYRQCWFENDSSFVYKTQLIKEKKLKGLGLWALGYDKGYNDIWNVISTELSKPPPAQDATSGGTNADGSPTSSDGDNSEDGASSSIVSSIVNTLGLTDPNSKINKVEGELTTVTNYKTILLYTMSFILFFACIGFLMAMIYPNTRNNFFNDSALKTYYIAAMLVFAIVIFRMQNWIDNDVVLLIVGFFIGISAFYLANKLIEKKQKDLP
ncbi:glycosyl hydrolase family 18 protein [Flavivirga amylovorans]|uniref:Glycosyl hydrolase family 18 protein n=1 Tax=Flavivirga amylovorans TaxID=870486 RepID=A0ABT8X4W2_9FLAO|nr:glycosyl hydrolase family 18 protein [Flavivirga amylovorans]MDO5988887.1 glycosyl hydrolase family 18 protein [Flavivirga amylovorans]